MKTVIEFPKLYDLTSTGKIKDWFISVHSETPTYAEIHVIHGQEDGKHQTAIRKVKAGKNIGKANETTAQEQATSEAQSMWQKKQDSGYREDRPTSHKTKISVPLPMLAHKFKERKHDLVWPAFVQPKLNGVRCLVERHGDDITFWSRKGKLYKNFGYMKPELLALMKDGEIRDGEMYNHGDISFQELCSLIKNEKNPDIEALKKYVKFYNYDIVLPVGFKKRSQKLYNSFGTYVKGVETHLIREERQVKEWHDIFVADGYEGIIVRSGGDEAYRLKYRVAHLLKEKNFIDEEFKIIGGKEGVGKDEGQCTFRCVTKHGAEFDVKCKGANHVREEQWKHLKKYIGKRLTVRYQNLSDDGIPIFPVGIVVRDYE